MYDPISVLEGGRCYSFNVDGQGSLVKNCVAREGSHYVPFIFRWPGVTKPGSVSAEVISQVDIMKTLAAITGDQLPEKAAPVVSGT